MCTIHQRNLEGMDAQAVLPIQAHEVRHNAAIVYMLVDVEMHEAQRRNVVPTKRYSTHFPFEMTRMQLLQWLGVQEYCNILEDKCLVMVNHKIWPQQHVAHKNFASGDYIQCVLPPPEATECEVSRTTASDLLQVLSGEGEDEPEDISMMQRVVAPQEENTPSMVQTHTLHIFAYGSDYLEVPIEGEITTLIEHISETWFIDLQSIVDIYEVLEPPFLYQQPGEQTFVMEMRGDSSLKLMDDDRLILAEVRLNSKHSSRRWSNKYAMWSRRLMGRQLALHLLRMQDFCKRRETKECALSHNNRLWTPQDRSEHVMSDGDYVLIEAFTEDISIQEARACLERFERHECSRRLFTVAEDAVPISGCDSGRGEADTTGTLRSRSRSRGASGGRAQGTAEEASLDPETTDSAHDPTRGLSLLQIRTLRIMSWDNFERLPPPGNPSNEVLGSPSIPLPGRSPEGNSSSSTHKQATQEVFVSDEEVEKEEGSKGAFQQSIMLKPDRMNFVKLMQRWNNNPLRLKIPDNIDARPVALQFLAQSFAGWDDDIRQLHIYTDGSYHPGMEIASFSFVIFGWNDEAAEEQKSSFVGWYSDVVTTDQMDPNFTGAQHQSSMEGGTSALMWSHIWLLQSGCQLPVVFHYDSQTSGHGAAGIFHIGSNNLQLKKLRQVVHLIQVIRTGPTDYEHVKAHSGSPQTAWPNGGSFKEDAERRPRNGSPSSGATATHWSGHGGSTAVWPIILDIQL